MNCFRKWFLFAICLFILPAVAFASEEVAITVTTPTPDAGSIVILTPASTPTPAPVEIPVIEVAEETQEKSLIPSVPTPEKQMLNPTYVETNAASSSGASGDNNRIMISVKTEAPVYSFEDSDVPVYNPLSTLPPLASESEYKLPIDFSGGKVPLKEGYITDYEYEDPTIHVKIERGREYDCTYWICEVRIADASQLRTASADGFDSNMTMPGAAIAKRVNAVVAIDGDYFCYTGRGYILRQGKLFMDRTTGGRDVLMIDEDGDFHIVRKAKRNECQPTINGKKVINAFFFGPVLVEDGVLGTEFRYTDMAYDLYSQRMAIAQVGKLHYKIICCESPKRGSAGMTLRQFAEFCQGKGVRTAYNLDGGDSTMLIFRNQKLNDIDNPHTREIADIIYFASAYTQE